MRCVHEAQLYPNNCSLTLTYNEENVPDELKHRDFQLFMKKLRKKFPHKTIRYYMGGEYGEQDGRPHFHVCLFNHDFHDKYHWKKTPTGHVLWRSPTLEQIWTQGHSTIGTLTFQSAEYIARYLTKKITGKQKQEQEQKNRETQEKTGQITKTKTPEYAQPSRRPGLGQNWLRKYQNDVYPHGYVIINARKARPPRYYDNIYKKTNPRLYRAMLERRNQQALQRLDDNTDTRLAAKAKVKEAQFRKLKRPL